MKCGICGSEGEHLEDMYEGDTMRSCTNGDCPVQGGVWTADEWKLLSDMREAFDQLVKLKQVVGYTH